MVLGIDRYRLLIPLTSRRRGSVVLGDEPQLEGGIGVSRVGSEALLEVLLRGAEIAALELDVPDAVPAGRDMPGMLEKTPEERLASAEVTGLQQYPGPLGERGWRFLGVVRCFPACVGDEGGRGPGSEDLESEGRAAEGEGCHPLPLTSGTYVCFREISDGTMVRV